MFRRMTRDQIGKVPVISRENIREYFKVKDDTDKSLCEAAYPFLIGYCRNGDNEPRYTILCMNKKGDFIKFLAKTDIYEALKRYEHNSVERQKDCCSKSDAWNVDYWVSRVMPKILTKLHENTCTFPCCERELHEKALAVEGLTMTEEEKAITDPDTLKKWYHMDLERMVFLFDQYDVNKCAEKNEFESELDGWIFDAPNHGEWWTKYCLRAEEIDCYREECLHKALQILDIYILALWD